MQNLVLLLDNHDSFVYNLARYVSKLGFLYKVHRSNKISLDEIEDLTPSHIIISPGPCTPLQAGISLDAIKQFAHQIPILGVCLGHQAIACAFGGKVVKASQPMHGKSSVIKHNQEGIFSKLENPVHVARYHSLIVERQSLPKCLEITAETLDGEIMGLQHKKYSCIGVQFHPESILTSSGLMILERFLRL